MKKLFLLRHAKSSWDDAALADFDRPLNERGKNAAPFMGEVIAKRGLMPDTVISSPAKRAMQTALLVKESAGINTAVKYDERIYEASPHALRQVASEIDDGNFSAMLVGHNPGMEGFVKYLTGSDESMPTAAIAIIDLEIPSWTEIAANCGRLDDILRPKELKALSD